MAACRQLWLEQDPGLALTAAVQVLLSGGVVLFPTDTVYGLLAWATSGPGYAELMRIKRRGPGKPLQLLAHPASAVAQQGQDALRAHVELALEFTAGKLTLVAPPEAWPGVPPAVLALQPGAMGVRAVRFAPLAALLTALPEPQLLWATSANEPGAAPCRDAAQAQAWLAEAALPPGLAVLAQAPCPGTASSVVRLTAGFPEVLR